MMRITEDGFIWKLISQSEAKVLYNIMSTYRLHEDGYESLVECVEEITSEGVYALEVGYAFIEDKVKLIRNRI